MQAVGDSFERTGTSNSNFSASARCWVAIMVPTRPKKGSLATSTRVGQADRIGDALGALDPGIAEFLDLLAACRCGHIRACGSSGSGRPGATAHGGNSRRPRRRHSRHRAPCRARRRWDRSGNRRPAPAPGRTASGLRSSRRLAHACWRSGRSRGRCRCRVETAPIRLGKLCR